MKNKNKASEKEATTENKRGPKPETVKINEDWQEAVKKSLQKKKPKEGWPKE